MIYDLWSMVWEELTEEGNKDCYIECKNIEIYKSLEEHRR